ncbi:MAG: glutamate--cysteine ligase [Clostridiales bacterium]|jgi:glutamate--cysteine ligase|nr:glutamate--cysteine ligase [Clostridiales bacterium]
MEPTHHLSSKQQLIDYFRHGIKNRNADKLGVEIEHFAVQSGSLSAVSYYGEGGVESALLQTAGLYHEHAYSEGHLIGMRRPGVLVTLEPAGQVEVSLGEFTALAEFEREYAFFRKELDPVLQQRGQRLINLGYHPTARVTDLPLIPKPRYRLMDAHFAATGRYGRNMMRGTASTQVSIDYNSEKDFSKKFRLANILTPVLAWLTDNAPVFEGERAAGMVRTRIWEDLDGARCGFAAACLDNPHFGFADYADYILDMPPILLIDGAGAVIPTGDKPVRALFPGEMSAHDAEHVLSMAFPHVRLKKYIEIRMADSLPVRYALGLVALVKGLFYNDNNLSALLHAFAAVDTAAALSAFAALKRSGADAEVYGEPVVRLCAALLHKAREGLPADERGYLDALATLITPENTARPLRLAE